MSNEKAPNREQRRKHNRDIDRQYNKLEKKKQDIIKRDRQLLTRYEKIEQWLKKQPKFIAQFAVTRTEPLVFITSDLNRLNDHWELFRTTMFVKKICVLRRKVESYAKI